MFIKCHNCMGVGYVKRHRPIPILSPFKNYFTPINRGRRGHGRLCPLVMPVTVVQPGVVNEGPCMHVCMYVCMHVCMYACMHVCMYVRMYLCMYVYVCMYTERQKKLITSSERRSLKSTASKLIIFRHR